MQDFQIAVDAIYANHLYFVPPVPHLVRAFGYCLINPVFAIAKQIEGEQ
jgi:hypothetical protein